VGKMNEIQIWTGTVVVLLIGLLIGSNVGVRDHDSHHMDMDHSREHFIGHKDSIISELIVQGEYQCCLEQPCVYCIEKHPGHGEGATCHCLQDVVNGVHPCGECIGEIMEGHGNKYLSKYFASAIAEKMGSQHSDAGGCQDQIAESAQFKDHDALFSQDLLID